MRIIYFAIIFLLSVRSAGAQEKTNVINASLNGLDIVFDASSGSILAMSHPATGIILNTTADSAGIVDMAFPLKEFEPLRLASRYSKNVRITKKPGIVTLY